MYEKGRIILAKQNSVIIDPGHGGSDPGAVYGNRREKDDTLALAYDIGNALEQRGIRVEYTRIGDIYNSPYEKAEIGNRSAADLFLSIHRNAMPVPGTGSGTMSLIFGRGGDAETFARNINKELAKTGWKDLGISERPNLVVLRDTALPAVLVEVGFIDNENDNDFFDANMRQTADAIADGIVRTFAEQEKQTSDVEEPGFYMVQTGIYRVRTNAEREVEWLKAQGFPAFMTFKDGFYYVRAGAFRNMEHAVRQELELRQLGYPTLLVKTRKTLKISQKRLKIPVEIC